MFDTNLKCSGTQKKEKEVDLLTDVNQCDFVTSLSSHLGNASSHQTSANHHHLCVQRDARKGSS